MQHTGKIVQNLIDALEVQTCNLQPVWQPHSRLARKWQKAKQENRKTAASYAFIEYFFACCGLTRAVLENIKNGRIVVQYGRAVFTLTDAKIITKNNTAYIVGMLERDQKEMGLKAVACKVV